MWNRWWRRRLARRCSGSWMKVNKEVDMVEDEEDKVMDGRLDMDMEVLVEVSS